MGAEAIIGGVSLGASVIGSLFSSSSAEEAGQDRAAMNQYRAAIAMQNSVIAHRQAEYESQIGQIKAFDQDLRTAAQLGRGRADIGASGFTQSGTKAQALDSAHEIGRYEAMQIVSNADRKAYEYRVKGYNAFNEAQLAMRGAENDIRAGEREATSSLLSGAASVGDRFSRLQSSGAFSSIPSFFG